jgi:Colicin V production protein
MFWALYLSTFFAGVAMMVREGLWSNTIALVNILVSGLVAFGFYSPLALYLDEQLKGQYTYLLDFACLWMLFVVTMLICRAVTALASRTRMRFKNPIDPVGGPLVALVAAWVLAAFTMATLHTIPMPQDAFGGKLMHSDSEVESNSGLTSPDLGWLRFVQTMSGGDSFGSGSRSGFSAKAFVKIYTDHRTKFGKQFPDGGMVVRRG